MINVKQLLHDDPLSVECKTYLWNKIQQANMGFYCEINMQDGEMFFEVLNNLTKECYFACKTKDIERFYIAYFMKSFTFFEAMNKELGVFDLTKNLYYTCIDYLKKDKKYSKRPNFKSILKDRETFRDAYCEFDRGYIHMCDNIQHIISMYEKWDKYLYKERFANTCMLFNNVKKNDLKYIEILNSYKTKMILYSDKILQINGFENEIIIGNKFIYSNF